MRQNPREKDGVMRPKADDRKKKYCKPMNLWHRNYREKFRENTPSETPPKAEVAIPDTPFAAGTEEAEEKKKVRKDETNKDKDEDPARVYTKKQPKENTQLPKKMRKDKKIERER